MYNKYLKNIKSSILKEVKLSSKNMKIKTSKLVDSVDIINSIINDPVLDDKGIQVKNPDGSPRFIAVKLPAELSFKFALLLKEIDPIVTSYQKVRNEKVVELGTPMLKDGKETGNYEFVDKKGKLTENGKKFEEEINKLREAEVDIKIPQIKIAEFTAGDIKIETGKLIMLDWLITQ